MVVGSVTLQQKAEGLSISSSCLRFWARARRFLARARLPFFSRTACECVLERAERESTGGTERERMSVLVCVCVHMQNVHKFDVPFVFLLPQLIFQLNCRVRAIDNSLKVIK